MAHPAVVNCFQIISSLTSDTTTVQRRQAAAEVQRKIEEEKRRIAEEAAAQQSKVEEERLSTEREEGKIIGRSPTADEAKNFIADMEMNASIAPEIKLTIENWDALFGERGTISTPIGEVKMGENQFAKLMRQGRDGKLGMIKPTLENPHAIIEVASEAKEGDTTERASPYIFIRSFKKADGSRFYYFTSITVSKDGREVVVSSQEKSRNKILRLLQEESVIWRTPKDATTSSAERQGLDYEQPNEAETATKGSEITPQSTSSDTKYTTNLPNTNELEEKIADSTIGEQITEQETTHEHPAASQETEQAETSTPEHT